MNPCAALVSIGPDDFFIASHFKQLGLTRFGVIGGDDGITIWQSLSTTGVVERL